MSGPAVKAEKLTRRFGGFTAVDAVSFEVAKGEIYGFLGANGAGKSTTIRMLCCILEPTAGDARVAGFDIRTNPEEIKKRLGYMSQKFSLYAALTVRENLEFYAGVYGLAHQRIRERQEEVLRETGLAENADRIVGVLPGGLKQQVALACALMHGPEILFLDEPTAGVDPLTRRRFWEIIDALSRRGTTVFVTTHYMDEVEHCHRAALMDAGRIITEGTIPEIKSSTFAVPLIEIDTDEVVAAYEALLPKEPEIGGVSMYGASIHVVPAGEPAAACRAVERTLDEKKIPHGAPRPVEPSMEDVFVKLLSNDSKGKT